MGDVQQNLNDKNFVNSAYTVLIGGDALKPSETMQNESDFDGKIDLGLVCGEIC